jgi:hypothetical protein
MKLRIGTAAVWPFVFPVTVPRIGLQEMGRVGTWGWAGQWQFFYAFMCSCHFFKCLNGLVRHCCPFSTYVLPVRVVRYVARIRIQSRSCGFVVHIV